MQQRNFDHFNQNQISDIGSDIEFQRFPQNSDSLVDTDFNRNIEKSLQKSQKKQFPKLYIYPPSPKFSEQQKIQQEQQQQYYNNMNQNNYLENLNPMNMSDQQNYNQQNQSHISNMNKYFEQPVDKNSQNFAIYKSQSNASQISQQQGQYNQNNEILHQKINQLNEENNFIKQEIFKDIVLILENRISKLEQRTDNVEKMNQIQERINEINWNQSQANFSQLFQSVGTSFLHQNYENQQEPQQQEKNKQEQKQKSDQKEDKDQNQKQNQDQEQDLNNNNNDQKNVKNKQNLQNQSKSVKTTPKSIYKNLQAISNSNAAFIQREEIKNIHDLRKRFEISEQNFQKYVKQQKIVQEKLEENVKSYQRTIQRKYEQFLDITKQKFDHFQSYKETTVEGYFKKQEEQILLSQKQNTIFQEEYNMFKELWVQKMNQMKQQLDENQGINDNNTEQINQIQFVMKSLEEDILSVLEKYREMQEKISKIENAEQNCEIMQEQIQHNFKQFLFQVANSNNQDLNNYAKNELSVQQNNQQFYG